MVTIIAEGPRGKRIAGVAPSVDDAKEKIKEHKKMQAYRDCPILLKTKPQALESEEDKLLRIRQAMEAHWDKLGLKWQRLENDGYVWYYIDGSD